MRRARVEVALDDHLRTDKEVVSIGGDVVVCEGVVRWFEFAQAITARPLRTTRSRCLRFRLVCILETPSAQRNAGRW